uniref:Uncharacterized protein n=1 Tax=Lepeophtheirus salmonis TaxID=72036 RepID=A0A0K2VGH2_LEPSM
MSQFLKSLILVFCLSVLETSCEKPYPRERDCKCGKEDVSSRIIGGTEIKFNLNLKIIYLQKGERS